MRPGELLWGIWVLLCVGTFWGDHHGWLHVNGDSASQFLDDKQNQVMRIANLAVFNEAHTCDLVANCSDECTHAQCAPLKSDNLTCTYVAVNTNCFADAADLTPCMDVRANFLRSYVRTPGGISGVVPFEMQNSICSQRMLDPLFQELQLLQNSTQYFFNFYFGSVDGIFRNYPGVEITDCYLYDPRIRPWYTGAISVLKDVVILLDSGYSMGGELELLTYQTTKFSAAQNTTEQILKTLTPKDRATVITFNASQVNPIAPSFPVPEAGLNLTALNFQQLLLAVKTTTASTIEVQGANFTAGLSQALSTFNQSSPPGALKIVILFTDGESTPSAGELDPIMAQFQQEHIRIFIYEIGDSTLNVVLANLTCQVEGYTERLNSLNLIQNPLFAIGSYFSFLARSQQNTSDGTTPFWQPVYTDYGNLGSVITVAFPAMSSDGLRLIGVAGIDVQVDGLNVNFRNLIETHLATDRRTGIATNTIGAAISTCNPAYNDSLGQCNVGSIETLSPLCKQDDNTSSIHELICCADCGIINPATPAPLSSDSTGINTTIIIIVVPAVAAVAAVALSVFLLFRFCRRRTQFADDYEVYVKIPKFSYETLVLATDNFRDENKLGSGNFGTVYRGTLGDGTKVAVKKLNYRPEHGRGDFEAEIRVLATANHTNLVTLKGFCVEHSILVYEFVENGDLDNWLFFKPVKDNKVLPWHRRVVIAKGVSKGLAYLHEDLQNQQKVCHSDIKPANILLDLEFNPKVADFGMAKLYDHRGSDMFATGGTMGYIAPEILLGAAATTRADVYSFGMVLLEMVSGRRFSDPTIRNMPLWAARNLADHKETEVFDPLLGELEKEDEDMATRLIRIALLCTSDNPDSRPDMGDVIKMIDDFMAVRSMPVSLENNSMADLNLTFSTETSSLGLSRSRSDKNSGLFTREKTWTFSEAIKKLKIRPRKSSGSSREKIPSS